MKVISKYVAKDGTEFDTEGACLEYESKGVQITSKDDAVSKTISSVTLGLVDNHYAAMKIEFTDGDFMVLVGGGYEGVGDYIEITDKKGFQ